MMRSTDISDQEANGSDEKSGKMDVESCWWLDREGDY